VQLAATLAPDVENVAFNAWSIAWPEASRSSTDRALLHGSQGEVLAGQHSYGRGRIGLIWLTDSYRLYTRGAREAHASLWSTIWAELARARAVAVPHVHERAITGQRAVVCDLPPRSQLLAPSGQHIGLTVQPDDRCAAFWPRESGWHRLLPPDPDVDDAAASPDDSINAQAAPSAFYVYDAGSVVSLARHRMRTETLRQANTSAPPVHGAGDNNVLRAMLLALWLLAMGTSWWLEKRHRGNSAHGVS
jgi:hypothetical protein